MPEPPKGRIILVRHGETEANRIGCFAASEDIQLTDLGRQQAEEVASSLERQFQPSMVYSSRFHRARQTAEIIAARFGLPVQTLPGVHERDFGCLKGEPYRHMGAMMKSDTAYDPEKRWLWAPHGGESLETVRARAIVALEALQTLHPRTDVVVVSHGAVMETVAAHLSGDWTTAHVPPNCGLIVIARL